MKEELIKFKTADLAEEKGYPFKYIITKELRKVPLNIPTQSLLQKWLREVYDVNNLNIFPHSLNDKLVGYRPWRGLVTMDNLYLFNKEPSFKSYEEALEKGLQEALKLIKV